MNPESPHPPADRKIAIIGKSLSTIKQGPYDDPSWEIWTLHDMVSIGQVPRSTRHFELHSLEWFRDDMPEYYRWLTEVTDIQLVLQEPRKEVPNGTAYPKHAIVEKFGTYFTNTVSWEIALAIHEGVDEIGLWGVDMAQATEYASQRPSCEYFLGFAAASGIRLTIPDESDLLKASRLYGFETDSGQMRKRINAKQREIAAMRREFADQRQQAALNSAKCEGALEILEMARTWV